MLDFDHIFRKHVNDRFAGSHYRRLLFENIGRFVSRKRSGPGALLLLGESGTGKTAILANYAARHEEGALYYFIEQCSLSTDPDIFLSHFIDFLNKKYELPCIDYPMGRPGSVNMLQERINDIHQRLSVSGQLQPVVIDAIDEAMPIHYNQSAVGIIDILNSLKFPSTFPLVFSSSRLPKDLRLLTEHSECKIIRLRCHHYRNRRDIREYLLRTLLPRDQKFVEQICDNSEGNFQYATLVSEALKKNECTANRDAMLEPDGLNSLYDQKLSRSVHRLPIKETRDLIWDAIRLISIVPAPLEPKVISELFGIRNPMDRNDVFAILEPFLESELFKGGQGQCRWFHQSFGTFAMSSDRTTSSDIARVTKRLADYAAEKLRGEGLSSLPLAISDDVIAFQSEVYGFDYAMNFEREVHLPLRLSEDKFLLVSNGLLFEAFQIFSLACRRAENIFFFHFLRLSSLYFRQFSLTNIVLIPDREPEWTGSVEDILDLREKYFQANDVGRLARLAINNYLKGEIPLVAMQLLLLNTFLETLDTIGNVDQEYERTYAFMHNWFPNSADEVSVSAISTLVPYSASSDAGPVLKGHMDDFVVYADWRPPQCIKKVEIELHCQRHASVDIWIKEPEAQYCHLGKPLEKIPESRLARLIKAMIRSAHNDQLPLGELYMALFSKNSGISNIELIQSKYRIQRELWALGRLFGLRFRYKYSGDPFPRIILERDFSYCLIEPISVKS